MARSVFIGASAMNSEKTAEAGTLTPSLRLLRPSNDTILGGNAVSMQCDDLIHVDLDSK